MTAAENFEQRPNLDGEAEERFRFHPSLEEIRPDIHLVMERVKGNVPTDTGTEQVMVLVDPLLRRDHRFNKDNKEMLNQEAFAYSLEREMARAIRRKTPLTLAFYDMDKFKRINDEYGHLIGNRVIEAIGNEILASGRIEDYHGHIGGDEFGSILPDTPLLAALQVVRRFQQAIPPVVARILRPEDPILAPTVTISAGLAVFNSDRHTDVDLFINDAERALKLGAKKAEGMHRIAVADNYGSFFIPPLPYPSGSYKIL